MTIQDYLRIIRERWKAILVTLLLCVVASLGYSLWRAPTYTATVSLYVSAQSGINTQEAFQGAQLSEQRVKSYTELVTGDRVMSETLRRLNIDSSEEALQSRVSATSALDSVIINITAEDSSPTQAARIANTVGTVTGEVVADLERPTNPNDAPPVAVRLVQPAAVPDQPSSIGLRLIAGIGLIAGLILGLAFAFLRDALDVSVRSLSLLNRMTGAPNLGLTPVEDTQTVASIALRDKPQGRLAEAFRQIRTNIQFIDVDQPRKVILLTSSRPGEGKTSTVANLAIAAASAGTSVLVIEADLRRPRLSNLLGLDNAVGLTSVLSSRVDLKAAVQTWNGAFDLLASGTIPPNPSELLASKQMRLILDRLRSEYDLILIDSTPILPVTDAVSLAPYTDGAILLCQYGKTTAPEIAAASEAVRAVSTNVLGTILSMCTGHAASISGSYHSYYSAPTPRQVNSGPYSRSTRPERQPVTSTDGGSDRRPIESLDPPTSRIPPKRRQREI